MRPLPPTPEEFRGVVSAEEWNRSLALTSMRRRIEWLAWHAIVRERLGDVGVDYNKVGVPVLLDADAGFISVSHSGGFVAVLWSNAVCAVDIELASRKITTRVAARFLSPEEQLLTDSANPLFAVSVWCAKEALYKYAGVKGADFLSDIVIESSDMAAGTMRGSVRDKRAEITLTRHEGLIVALIAD